MTGALGNAAALLAALRRGDACLPELTVEQIEDQLGLAVDRVIAEGGLYDRQLAALAIKQSWGDLVEAACLVRTFRTTLPRFYDSLPVDTLAMDLSRRISAILMDVPGGQIIGPSLDSTPRRSTSGCSRATVKSLRRARRRRRRAVPGVIEVLRSQGLIEAEPQGEPRTDLVATALPLAGSACSRSRVPTRGFCWDWLTRPSATRHGPSLYGRGSGRHRRGRGVRRRARL